MINTRKIIQSYLNKEAPPRIIAIDFDDTIVEKTSDMLNTDLVFKPFAKETVSWIKKNFYTILWTCRDGEALDTALQFLSRNNLNLHTVNKNAPFLGFETSNKIFFDFCVDDRTIMEPPVDWLSIKILLQEKFLCPQ